MSHDPFISVIIPTLNGANTLGYCLQSLMSQNYSNYEIIVVDNNSTDSTAQIAKVTGVRVLSYSETSSANICRNIGAEHSRGEILLFTDSDVIIPPGVLKRCAEYFQQPNTSAVIGVYSAKHRNPNICSQYKNFWIRYSYLYQRNKIGGIFGAISAIRKKVFIEAGEFNENLVVKEIDDLELGIRVKKLGHEIHFKEDFEVEHLKAYTFKSLIKNQYNRTLGFFTIAARSKIIANSLSSGVFNIYPAFIYSTVIAPMLVLSLSVVNLYPILTKIWFTLACVYCVLNFPFYRAYLKYYNILETLGVIILMFIDHLVCSIGVVASGLRFLTKKLIPSAARGR